MQHWQLGTGLPHSTDYSQVIENVPDGTFATLKANAAAAELEDLHLKMQF